MNINKYFNFDKLKHKKIIISCTLIFTIICSFIIFSFSNYSIYINGFKNEFNNYNFSKAYNFLLTNELHNPFKSLFLQRDLSNFLNDKTNSLTDDIDNGKISSDYALLELKEIDRYDIIPHDDLIDVSLKIPNIDESVDNYNNGIISFENGDFKSSIASLEKVSPLDLNYDNSLKYIDKSKEKYKESVFEYCDSLADKDYYSKAINTISDNISYIGNDSDVQNKIQELKDKKQAYIDKTSAATEASSDAFESNITPNNINNLNIKSNTTYFINVNLNNQTTYVYKGNSSSWKLLKTFPCSTGSQDEKTPSGSFYTQEKGDWFFSEKYNQGAKYWTQITGDILFHSVPYARDKTTVLDYNLDEPSSHGCIRLALENAKWIYNNIPKGTKVIIK